MRVTANTFPDALVKQLSDLTARQNRLQNQAASGQRIRLPADDPSAMRRVMDLQTELGTTTQYRRNASALKDAANATYEVMRSLKRVSDRAGELAVLAGGTRSDEELKVYAAEVNQLIEQAVQTANRKWGNRFLLAGTEADQPPFVLEVDSQGRATGVTYQGNTRVAESEIAARVTVSAQTVGANETGGGPRGLLMDDRFGADFFNHLIDLRDRLNAGDRAGIAGISQSALALDEENFLFHMAQNGTVQARLEATMANATHQTDNLEVRMSQEADADLPQVLVRLNQTQNAYRAALQSGATLLEQSLLDFIR